MPQGSVTPYSGQLFDNKTALRWGNYLEQCKARLKADVEYQRRVDQAQIDFLTSSLAAREDQFKVVTIDYQKQLAEARDPAFYKTTWFGVVIGVVGTVAAITSTAYLVHSVKLHGQAHLGLRATDLGHVLGVRRAQLPRAVWRGALQHDRLPLVYERGDDTRAGTGMA